MSQDYPQLDPNEARVLVVEAVDKLLGHMGGQMPQVALDRLRAIGVEVWLNAQAQEVTSDHLTTSDGRSVQTHTVIWATGVRAPDVVAGLDAPHAKAGSLAVDEYLQVRGLPGVYAAGDCAHIQDSRYEGQVPLLAAAAVQEGEAVARNIVRAVDGRPQVAFRYRSFGNLVSLGRFGGVAEIGGITVSGALAWTAWRAVHLARLSGFRDRLATVVDWTTGVLYHEDTSRLEVQPLPGVLHPERATSGA